MMDLLEGDHHIKLLHPMELVGLDLPAINICGKSISASQRETLLRSVDGVRIKAVETSVLAWSLTSENFNPAVSTIPSDLSEGEGPLHTGICSSCELQMSKLQGEEPVTFHLKGWFPVMLWS